MHLKHAEGKEIILLQRGTSFGIKWGTAMQSRLFPLRGAYRHSWPEEALQRHLPLSSWHPPWGEWGSEREFNGGNSHWLWYWTRAQINGRLRFKALQVSTLKHIYPSTDLCFTLLICCCRSLNRLACNSLFPTTLGWASWISQSTLEESVTE